MPKCRLVQPTIMQFVNNYGSEAEACPIEALEKQSSILHEHRCNPHRMSSERLPGKALLDICGRPMCYHLFDRVAASSFITDISKIVVCTTHHSSDDVLVEAVTRYGCSIFRGDEDDIIKRFYDANKKFGFDYMIQADGDDPLSATEYMDKTYALQRDSFVI